MTPPPPDDLSHAREFLAGYLDQQRRQADPRLLRGALVVSLIALGVATGALCHVMRVLGC